MSIVDVKLFRRYLGGPESGIYDQLLPECQFVEKTTTVSPVPLDHDVPRPDPDDLPPDRLLLPEGYNVPEVSRVALRAGTSTGEVNHVMTVEAQGTSPVFLCHPGVRDSSSVADCP